MKFRRKEMLFQQIATDPVTNTSDGFIVERFSFVRPEIRMCFNAPIGDG